MYVCKNTQDTTMQVALHNSSDIADSVYPLSFVSVHDHGLSLIW